MPRDPKHDVLFEPIRIGPKTMKNRFYLSPFHRLWVERSVSVHLPESPEREGGSERSRGATLPERWARIARTRNSITFLP